MHLKPVTQTDQFPLQLQTSETGVKTVWIQSSIIYLISWLIVYQEWPVPVRLLCMVIFICLCLRSINDAASIFLLFLFIPFYTEFLGIKISGINAMRIIALPYLYITLKAPQLRSLQLNKVFIFLLIFSLTSIFISAELRKIVQEIPVYRPENSPGYLNFFARLFDISLIILFIYLSLTRLRLLQIVKLYDLILLYGMFEALTIIFLVIQSPESIIGAQFDEYYLWRNPYFGHKNDWGMMLVFIVLAAFIKEKISDGNKSFYYAVMILCTLGVLFSLSRQAYFSYILGFLIISFLMGNVKPAFYLILILGVLVVLQPAFLFERLNSAMNIGSVEDFQNISRKVGELAQNQFKSNLTLIPQMFIRDYEYNWSEGFYNGLAHQQGILGLLFQVVFYVYLSYRYFTMSKSNLFEIHHLGSQMCAFMIIILISNFNRRGINFMHYDGKIEQFSFLLITLTFMTEFTFFHYKHILKKDDVKRIH